MHAIHHWKSAALAAFLSLSLALAACGGGDSDEEPSGATEETPTAAVASGGKSCRPAPYLISLRAAKGGRRSAVDAASHGYNGESGATSACQRGLAVAISNARR